MDVYLVIHILGFSVVCGFVHFVFCLHQHRSKIDALRKQGMPMPKGWSWITGHLGTLHNYKSRFPHDASVNTTLSELALEFNDTGAFLLDLWPISPPNLIVCSPEVAEQIATKHNLPKPRSFGKMLEPITGGPNILTMNGEEWKTWRTLLNPGFSSANMKGYIPHVVECVQIFHGILQEMARKEELFSLTDLTTRLTIDVIMKLTLNSNLDCQRSEDFVGNALTKIIHWHSVWNPIVLMNPLRLVVQKYHGYLLNKFIHRELRNQFEEYTSEQDVSKEKHSKTAKSVVSLVIGSHISEHVQKNQNHTELDPRFSRYTTNLIRLFLFAGRDTTSSSIVYIYHLLSKHPQILEKLRAEHNNIFGTDACQAAALLNQNPTLLNQCRYTTAVIKETLRLYAPAATMRTGNPTVALHVGQNTYPTDYISTTILHQAVHLNPCVWPRPLEFLPERFLVDSDHDLYPVSAAYRPFEQGPRACMGQILAYIEMKTVLILTARSLKITPAYEDWSLLRAKERGWAERIAFKMGLRKESIETVHGDRAYQSEGPGAHPKDGYPCRVEFL